MDVGRGRVARSGVDAAEGETSLTQALDDLRQGNRVL
jgi:hypothetical protein